MDTWAYLQKWKSTQMYPIIAKWIFHILPRVGEGWPYMNLDYVAHLVLLTPSSAGQTIYQPGKPGEIVEKMTRGEEGCLSWEPGIIFKKYPYIRVAFCKKAAKILAVHRPKNENNPVAHMVLKVLTDLLRFLEVFQSQRSLENFKIGRRSAGFNDKLTRWYRKWNS